MKARLFGAIGVLYLVLLASGEGFVREYSGDFHWHVVLGEQTLGTHQIASTDAFSHTYAGRPMRNTAWLGDVILALGFRGGYAGAYVVRTLALLILVLLLLREGQRAGLATPAAALLAALPLLYAPLQRYLRPELFAFACLAALFWLLGAHEQRRRRAPLVGAIFVLILWANVHGSVSLGLLLCGFYALDRGVRALVARDWRGVIAWCAFPPLCLAAACVSPLGIHGPLAFEILRPAWLLITPEWQPLPSWPSWLLVLAAITVLAAVAAGRRVSWWRLGVALVLAVFAMRFRRFLVPALIAVVPLLATSLGVLRTRFAGARVRAAAAALGLVAAGWGAWMVLGEAQLAREVGLGVDPGAYPEAACAWASRQRLDGNLFNSGTMGSYLMWCLPDHPVYTDQRAWSLYGADFFQEYLDAARDPAKLEALVRPHDLGWAFTGYDTIGQILSAEPERWRLVYFDDLAQIYVRVDRPENAALVAEGFVRLDPGTVASLPHLSGARLTEAQVELARQQARCPTCTRTLLAAAGVAVAARDGTAYDADMDELLARGETPEIAYLAACRAESLARWMAAAGLYERFRALGGDPILSRLLEAHARHHGGDPAGAATLLDEVAGLPGGAVPAARMRADLAAGD